MPEIYMFLSSPAFVTHHSPPAPRPGRRAGAWERGGSSFALLWPQRFARMKSLGWGVSRAGGVGCRRGVDGDPKGNKLRTILHPLSPCLCTGRGRVARERWAWGGMLVPLPAPCSPGPAFGHPSGISWVALGDPTCQPTTVFCTQGEHPGPLVVAGAWGSFRSTPRIMDS